MLHGGHVMVGYSNQPQETVRRYDLAPADDDFLRTHRLPSHLDRGSGLARADAAGRPIARTVLAAGIRSMLHGLHRRIRAAASPGS